jgi:uncharacterized membrane protein
MLSIFRKKPIDLFSGEEKDKIRDAIQAAEKHTSGEVRVYVEDYCEYEDPIQRAAEIFHGLKMDQTVQHNGVLLYLAIEHKKLAIYADAGIYAKVDHSFWNESLYYLKEHFRHENFTKGIVEAVEKIGNLLSSYFPYDPNIDKNELPDELVFGNKQNQPGSL